MGSATNRIGGGGMAPKILEKINDFLKFTIDFLIILTLSPPPNFKPVADPLLLSKYCTNKSYKSKWNTCIFAKEAMLL